MSTKLASNKKLFNAIIYLASFVSGSCLAAHQAMVGKICADFGASSTVMGTVIGALYTGSFLMVVIFGELSEKIGKKRVVLITGLAVSTGALTVALAPSVTVVTVGYFLYGCGVGAFESTIYAAFTDANPENSNRYMCIAQAIYSLGAVVSPILVGQFFLGQPFAWKNAYIVIVAAFVCSTTLVFTRKNITNQVSPAAKGEKLVFLKLLRSPTLVVYMLVMLCYLGFESGITYWAVNYFDELGASELGTYAISAYWLVSIAGRVVGSFIKREREALCLSLGIAAVGMGLTALAPSPVIKLVGIGIVGLGFAPAYPTLLGAGVRQFPQFSGATFSVMTFSGALGGSLFQPLFGSLVAATSTQFVYTAIFVGIIVMAVALTINVKCENRLLARRAAECALEK